MKKQLKDMLYNTLDMYCHIWHGISVLTLFPSVGVVKVNFLKGLSKSVHIPE